METPEIVGLIVLGILALIVLIWILYLVTHFLLGKLKEKSKMSRMKDYFSSSGGSIKVDSSYANDSNYAGDSDVCPHCNGEGEVINMSDSGVSGTWTCSYCGGTGRKTS